MDAHVGGARPRLSSETEESAQKEQDCAAMQQVVWKCLALYASQNKVQLESSQDNDDGRFLDVEKEEKEVIANQLEIIDFETETSTDN